MDNKLKEDFISAWKRFFGEAELPITFYYTDEEGKAELVKPRSGQSCVFVDLSRVRNGNDLCFDAKSIACFGGRRFLGFSEKVIPDFESFLSCGISGKFEGERYKKNPEIAAEFLKHVPQFKAPAKFIVFKRWDHLGELDTPEVVIFFAQPDVLSGLFTLANFDEIDPNSVITPFSPGCSSIVQHPFFEKDKAKPRAVIGLFDVSARPFVPENTLTFSVPMSKFEQMVQNMDQSFLITKSWKAVQKRIKPEPP